MFLLALLAPVVLQADLDGIPGSETITFENQMLRAGGAELTVKLDRTDGFDAPHLEVVSIGKRRAVYLATYTEGSEDPPVRHRVFLYTNGLLKEVYNAVWDDRRIAWTKQGHGRILESGWSACTRMQKKSKKRVLEVKLDVIQVRLVGSKMVETRTRSDEIQKCDELSACPFVYEVKDGKPQLVGEILRNVRYTPALQSLSLGEGQGATIRLTEEKPEVTFLDEIYLDVDGVRVAPATCKADPKLPYCAADGRYHVMSTGAVLPLVFEAEAGKRTLFARGYYNPMTADH